MLRYNDTYKEHFEDSKDPDYENNFRFWLTVVRWQADYFFKTPRDVGDAKLDPSEISYPPNRLLIERAVINAFSDIKRIKNYHKVGNAERIKFAAYIGYWLARSKPFSVRRSGYVANPIIENGVVQKGTFNFFFAINEVFIAEFMLAVTFGRNVSDKMLAANTYCSDSRKECKFKTIPPATILDSLEYYLCYRLQGAQELELFLKGLLACPTDCIRAQCGR